MISTATLLSLVGLVLPALLDFAVKWAVGFNGKTQDRADGANDSTAAANKESADAQARMSQVNAAPRGPDIAADRLRDGTF